VFTGIIQDIGRVASVTSGGSGRVVTVATRLAGELHIGDSIAVDGVCLTVTSREADGFSADVSPTTARLTTFDNITPGQRVNLELPLRPTDRIGGHWVMGHVDAVGVVAETEDEGDVRHLTVRVPPPGRSYLVERGSVAVSGVSLTIVSVADDGFRVTLIPHTLSVTTLGDLVPGARVNLEYDIVGKYVLRLAEVWRNRTG
jgi:riboflavin synthase